ncbi:MAG: glycosyltransferase family 4 protein [Flavobacteriales bacterium]|nr:MAG: glycosyltransferase family 4 protein [Flavobacteriales bacterium]
MAALKPVLLYLYPKNSTFIARDVRELGAQFDVRTHELLRGPKWLLPWRLLLQFAWLLRNGAMRTPCICHFSGYHAVLPSLLAKRCSIILAGADCTSIPAIGYGNFNRTLLGWATGFAARHAYRLLPISEHLIESVQTYDPSSPARQGIATHVPGLTTPHTEVPYGFDPTHWPEASPSPRLERCVVSITGPAAPGNAVHQLKGVDLLLAAAREMPEWTFIIIGVRDPAAYGGAPANVEFVAWSTPDELRKRLSSARYYAQLSMSEGFGNALCEAMLCGCIPIVSNVGAMPRICGTVGGVVMKRDAGSVIAALQGLDALSLEQRTERSKAARQRIITGYPLEARTRQLVEVVLGN